VRSVNRGMALHPERDVVLLNSDAEVANDWLDRLAAAAQSADDVATVTPFSNNATICSYPFEGWTAGVPGTLGLAALDRLFAQANRGQRADIPTAVGFCMYIRRACLDRIGAFDAERFGRGYGEENDFCLRASAAGWRHVIAADVFVFHEGAVSFSEGRAAQLATASAALLERHPGYAALVHEFLSRDPLAPLRTAVDHARAAVSPAEAAAVLREREAERTRVLAEVLDEREALRRGLAQATAIVEERTAQLAARDRDVDERDAEIARLHVGLDNAAALAVERLQELERIHRLPLWRFYRRLVDRRRNG
jgi:O-antigen biosynthesis protein